MSQPRKKGKEIARDKYRYSVGCNDPKEEFQRIVKENVKNRIEQLTPLLKRKPPRDLLLCDEDALRDFVGRHRILPKELRTDFVLQKAFRKSGISGGNDSLISLFEKDYDLKGEDFHNYLYQGFYEDSMEIQQEKHKLQIEEEYRNELFLYLFIYYSIVRGYLGMTRKIAIFESVKKILKEVGSKKFEVQKIPSELVELKENKKKKRKLGTPSFDRFRQNLLHDMHVERRPLSWFEKRVEYFRKKNKKNAVNASQVKTPLLMQTKSKEPEVSKVMKKALQELLALQRSNVYENFYNPEEILLEKLTSMMQKMSRSMNRIEETEKENNGSCSKASIHNEPDGLENSDELESEESTEELEHFLSRDVGFKIWEHVKNMLKAAEKIDSTADFCLKGKRELSLIMELTKVSRCNTFRKKILSDFEKGCRLCINEETGGECLVNLPDQKEYYKNLSKELLKMILGFEVHPDILLNNPVEERTPVFQSYLRLEEEEEEELLKRIEKGAKYESFKENFDNIWKNSALTGVCLFNNEIQLMEHGKIIIRPQKEKECDPILVLTMLQRVRLLSGGRVGGEPLYPEYVARGMLDCVVLGDRESPPSVLTILKALVHIATDEGVLMIIMNEIEYRFNFLLAAVSAKELGILTAIVHARDDVSSPQVGREGKLGRRGSAGIVLLYKLAAGMAAEGHHLSAIRRECQYMCVSSLSCYTDTIDFYIGNGNEYEEGKKIDKRDLVSIVRRMLYIIMNPNTIYSFQPEPGCGLVLLLNIQHMSSRMVSALVLSISEQLKLLDAKLSRLYSGSWMSLGGRRGFTLTLAKDREGRLTKYLDLPTLCPLWPPHLSTPHVVPLRHELPRSRLLYGVSARPQYTQAMGKILLDILNGLKNYSESSGSAELVRTVKELEESYLNQELLVSKPLKLLAVLGKHLEQIPGFGEQLALALYAAAQEFKKPKEEKITWRVWVEALFTGATSLACCSRHTPGDGTMSNFLLELAKAVFKTESGTNPVIVMKTTLDKLKKCFLKRNELDSGIKFCSFIFNLLAESMEKNISYLGWERCTPPPASPLPDSSEWIKQRLKIVIYLISEKSATLLQLINFTKRADGQCLIFN